LRSSCRSYRGIQLLTTRREVFGNVNTHKTLQGKDAFDAEIENESFEESPTIMLDRLIEEGDSVVATGAGSVAQKAGARREFVFCEVFTFTGEAVSRLDTYHVWLSCARRNRAGQPA
jgi:hypothetical protein